MSTAKLVQLTIGGNFPYTANMWPTITQRAAIPRRPSRYPMRVKVVCFIIRLIKNDNFGNFTALSSKICDIAPGDGFRVSLSCSMNTAQYHDGGRPCACPDATLSSKSSIMFFFLETTTSTYQSVAHHRSIRRDGYDC